MLICPGIIKEAIFVDEIPNIYMNKTYFREPRRFTKIFEKALKLHLKDANSFPEPLPTAENVIGAYRLFAIPVGRLKGIHHTGGGASGMLKGVSGQIGVQHTKMSPDANKVFNQVAMAHEGIEINNTKKLYSMAGVKGKHLADYTNISPGNVVPDHLKYIADIDTHNRFFSHANPDVLLQEGNILATLKGTGADEAANMYRSIRKGTRESSTINRQAEIMGFKNFEFGRTRINRNERKHLNDFMVNNPIGINNNIDSLPVPADPQLTNARSRVIETIKKSLEKRNSRSNYPHGVSLPTEKIDSLIRNLGRERGMQISKTLRESQLILDLSVYRKMREAVAKERLDAHHLRLDALAKETKDHNMFHIVSEEDGRYLREKYPELKIEYTFNPRGEYTMQTWREDV